MSGDDDDPYEKWPGLFSVLVLHRIAPGNRARVQAEGRRFGLADCGAACVPVPRGHQLPVSLGWIYCGKCWPSWPHEDAKPESPYAQENLTLPALPRREPGASLRELEQPIRGDQNTPWFSTVDALPSAYEADKHVQSGFLPAEDRSPARATGGPRREADISESTPNFQRHNGVLPKQFAVSLTEGRKALTPPAALAAGRQFTPHQQRGYP